MEEPFDDDDDVEEEVEGKEEEEEGEDGEEDEKIQLVVLPDADHPLVDAVVGMEVDVIDQHFIERNEDMLVMAWASPDHVALAVMIHTLPIGFAMVSVDRQRGDAWIHSFMIDRLFQGQGWGRRAFRTLLEWIRREHPSVAIVELASQNPIALSLYRSIGFVEVHTARAVEYFAKCGETLMSITIYPPPSNLGEPLLELSDPVQVQQTNPST